MATVTPYFLTKKSRSKRHTSPTGDEWHTPKKWTIIDGDYVYINDAPINQYEMIQAERDSVDLELILARYESGDKDALDRVTTMYIDTIDMPKSYAQMFERVEQMKDIFASMPNEIKGEFNNNAATFWKKAGSAEFDDILNRWRSNVLSKDHFVDSNPVNLSVKTESEVKE